MTTTISLMLMIIFLSKTSQAIEDEVNSQNNNGPPAQGIGSLQSPSVSLLSPPLSYSNEMPINDPYLMLPRHNSYLKRAWQSLQGPWGKRTNELYNNMGPLVAAAADDYPALNRNYHDRYNLDENNNIDGTIMNGGGVMSGASEYDADRATFNDDYDFSNIGKRAWKSMNSAWGKRVNSNSNWNNFRGKLILILFFTTTLYVFNDYLLNAI